MRKRLALWMKVAIAVALIAIAGVVFISTSPKASYVWKAYVYPGSNESLRGYPTIEPSGHFTGTWVHYSFSGRPIAILSFVEGKGEGKQIYLRDDGTPYVVRYLANGHWERDELSLRPPENVVIPWFLPQRWINRSLDRLSILDKLFSGPQFEPISKEQEAHSQ